MTALVRSMILATAALMASPAPVALDAMSPRQHLDLDSPPKPPELPEPNAATALAAVLAREVDALESRIGADDADARAMAASIAWRCLAHELLMRGDDPADRRHGLVVAGFRMADARGEFDRTVARIPGSGDAATRVNPAIERFVASPALLRAAPATQMHQALAAALAGLEPVLEALGLPRVVSPWPIARGRGEAPAPPGRWGERLAEAASHPSLAPEIAGPLRTLAASLAAAEAWPDLQPEAALLGAPLLRVTDRAPLVLGAGWLPVSLRESLKGQWASALEAVADPNSRHGGMRSLALLERVAAVVEAAGPLLAPRRGQAPRGPIDPARLVRALRSLSEVPVDDPGAAAAMERLGMIESLLRTMVEVRGREVREVRRELRNLRRDLTRDALRAEEPVLRQVESLAAPDAHPADPASASLLESQRRRIRAIDALDGVDSALAEIEAMLPAHARPLVARWRGALPALSDPARADAALIRCERFIRQWARLRAHPAEVSIRNGDAATLELTFGRAAELLAALDRHREAWIAAWAEGDADRAADAIEPMLSLLDLLEDAAALSRARANPRIIGRWGGWDDLGGVPGATDAMDARVALAVEALARGDDAALREAMSLQRREAPLWRLRARLTRLLAADLASLPEGLAGAIGRAGSPPPPEALLAERAEALFTLNRYAREYLHATAAGDRAGAERLHEFLRAMASELLREVEALGEANPLTRSDR